MDMSLTEMNRPIDPANAEEVKGGSGHVGKFLFSYGLEKVGILAYISEEQKGKVNAKKWIEEIVNPLKGKILTATDMGARAEIAGNKDKGLFPIKLKDEALTNSIRYLQKVGVFPEGDSDSEEECCYGDDDSRVANRMGKGTTRVDRGERWCSTPARLFNVRAPHILVAPFWKAF